MDKAVFLDLLRERLSDFPFEDRERTVEYYTEMIDDQIESGISEQDVLASLGDVDEIVGRMRSEIPLTMQSHTQLPRRKLRAGEIVLIVLGSPVWLPVLLSVFLILLSLYLVVWSLILSLYAIALSLTCCLFAGIVASVLTLKSADVLHAAFLFGAGCILGGVSILFWMLSVWATKAFCKGTGKMVRSIKAKLTGKERTK